MWGVKPTAEDSQPVRRCLCYMAHFLIAKPHCHHPASKRLSHQCPEESESCLSLTDWVKYSLILNVTLRTNMHMQSPPDASATCVGCTAFTCIMLACGVLFPLHFLKEIQIHCQNLKVENFALIFHLAYWSHIHKQHNYLLLKGITSSFRQNTSSLPLSPVSSFSRPLSPGTKGCVSGSIYHLTDLAFLIFISCLVPVCISVRIYFYCIK